MAALSSSLDSGVNYVAVYHRGQAVEVRMGLEVRVFIINFYSLLIFFFFFSDSKHSMAALSSSLDSGVNSVAVYHRDQVVEVRVRLEVRVRVLRSEGPLLGCGHIGHCVNGRGEDEEWC